MTITQLLENYWRQITGFLGFLSGILVWFWRLERRQTLNELASKQLRIDITEMNKRWVQSCMTAHQKLDSDMSKYIQIQREDNEKVHNRLDDVARATSRIEGVLEVIKKNGGNNV